jgi:hypothetical protein
LDFSEAVALISLYRRFGLGGVADVNTKPHDFAKRIKDDSVAVACCRILNDFRPLDRIIHSLMSASNPTDRFRYTCAALAQYCFRGGLRYEILAAIAGTDGLADQWDFAHPLPLDHSDYRRDFIVPASSTLATRTLELTARESLDTLFDCFVALGNAIAPRVNRKAIQSRSPEARLAGRLFDYDQVVSTLLGQRAEELYDAVRDSWQWNARYWEQVALLNLAKYYQSKPTDSNGIVFLDTAVQNARHAVSLEEHPLSLTTLGKILFISILSGDRVDYSLFDEAYRRLKRAIELERKWLRPRGHPYVTLFHGVSSLLKVGARLEGQQVAELREYIKEARSLFGRSPEVAPECDMLEELLSR